MSLWKNTRKKATARLQGMVMFLLDKVHRWKANDSKYIPSMLWAVLITGKLPISPICNGLYTMQKGYGILLKYQHFNFNTDIFIKLSKKRGRSSDDRSWHCFQWSLDSLYQLLNYLLFQMTNNLLENIRKILFSVFF